MELRSLIGRIGETYDRSLDMSSEAQSLLRAAGQELGQWVPAGYLPRGSGGNGAGAFVPWISVFEPDETTTAQRGMYVVYLFAQDMQTVALSLNQGVTELVKKHGTAQGRQLLKNQADVIRNALLPALVAGLEPTINLASRAALPVHYESGNILAKTYELADLPDEATMVADLRMFIRLYQEALAVREGIRQTEPGTIVTAAQTPVLKPDRPVEFKPKSAADYIVTLKGRTLVKSRTHEKIIKDYGGLLTDHGLNPNTDVHPRDMTVIHNGDEWLIEVKMVRRGDAVSATRDAIGQLLSYRYFHYAGREDHVRLLAVFSEDIGSGCMQLLESLTIASVWRTVAGWDGSPTAKAARLC